MTSVIGRSDEAFPGRVIARKYRLDGLLGEGGMGSIWRAYNLQLELPVAIKLLRTDSDTSELAERLRVEARAAAKLVHPSIVRVFDIGETEWGDPFIVMELLDGESLAGVIDRGALVATEALRLLLPIAEALALAHSRGVIHRDLKPENIFLVAAGNALEPKLLDFGIAKVMSVEAGGTRTLTQTGTLLGSPDYMSPEQAYGRADIDERSDVWSFCIVLYEALTGQTPFRGDSCAAVLRSVVRDEPIPLEAFGVEPRLAALIASGLMKDRSQRPSSMLELGRELALWLAAQGVVDDATGASLEAKWLGRPLLLALPVASAAPARRPPSQDVELLGEQATLRSVTNPHAPVSHQAIVLDVRQRGRRRLLGAAVVVTTLAGGAAWASWERPMRRQGSPTAWPATSAASVDPALPPPAAARADIIAVDALPPLPRAVPVASAGATKKPPAMATQPTTFHVAAPPAASSLPRALPARGQRVDLLNPY